MTDREKLVEIVCQAMQEVDCIEHCNHTPCYKVHHVVDELIAHGVTVKEMQKPIAETDLGKYLDTAVWFEEFGVVWNVCLCFWTESEFTTLNLKNSENQKGLIGVLMITITNGAAGQKSPRRKKGRLRNGCNRWKNVDL